MIKKYVTLCLCVGTLYSAKPSKKKKIDLQDSTFIYDFGFPFPTKYILYDSNEFAVTSPHSNEYHINNTLVEMEEIEYIFLDQEDYTPQAISTSGLNGCFGFGIILKDNNNNQFALIGHVPPEKEHFINNQISAINKEIEVWSKDKSISYKSLICIVLPDKGGSDKNTVNTTKIPAYESYFITKLVKLLDITPIIAFYYERENEFFDIQNVKPDFKITLSPSFSYWEYFGDNYIQHKLF